MSFLPQLILYSLFRDRNAKTRFCVGIKKRYKASFRTRRDSDNAAKTKLEADVKSIQVKSLRPQRTMINNTTTGKKKSRIKRLSWVRIEEVSCVFSYTTCPLSFHTETNTNKNCKEIYMQIFQFKYANTSIHSSLSKFFDPQMPNCI